MRKLFLLVLTASLVGCAPTVSDHETKYEAYCKTHARKVTMDESPTVENAFRDCMQLKGLHEVEIREVK